MLKIKLLIVWLTLFQIHFLTADERIVQYLFQFLDDFAQNIEKELDIQCSGKWGDLKINIEQVNVSFYTQRRATIEEARALQVYLMDKLVQKINDDEELQPYFFEKPFTFKRVDISIDFNDPYNRSYYDGTVTRVRNINDLAGVVENRNKIFYKADDPFTNKIYNLLVEPYEEAVRLAEIAQLKFPYVHPIKEQEVEIDRLFEVLTIDLYKKHKLYVQLLGGKMTQGIEEIGARLRFFKPVTIQEARNLEFLVINRLLSLVNENEILKKHLKEHPFSSNRLKISIEFLKKTGAPYYNGSIDEVKFNGSEFAYLSKPPDLKEGRWEAGKIHHEPSVYHQETYEEAKQALK
ncbi:MAG: hypothetical protein H0V82_12800 [Candidatus Protochlamydia sp.]|nr:hypothetical protein [Candidatus Protochlamydia sp.]